MRKSVFSERKEGIFHEGSLVKGTITKTNGDVIEGTFRHNLLCGNGMYASKSKRSIYKGHFVDGEKHGWGEELYQDRSMTLSNKHSGFFSNGSRSGTGRLSYYDTGFGFKRGGEVIPSQLIVDANWIAGNPKAGGVVDHIEMDTSMFTTDVLQSKYEWLYRLKRIENKKDDKCHQDTVQEYQDERKLRKVIEQKRNKIFDSHRTCLLEKLSSYYNQLQISFENAEPESIKEKRQRSTLPSRTSYFTKRKINIAPQLLTEAQERPGLRMKECVLKEQDKLMYQLVKEMEAKLNDSGLSEPKVTKPMKLVREEYSQLEERWKLINCENMITS